MSSLSVCRAIHSRQQWLQAISVTKTSVAIPSLHHSAQVEEVVEFGHGCNNFFEATSPNKCLLGNHGIFGVLQIWVHFNYSVWIEQFLTISPFVICQVEPINNLVHLQPHFIEWWGQLQRSPCGTKSGQVAHVVICNPDFWEVKIRPTFQQQEHPD